MYHILKLPVLFVFLYLGNCVKLNTKLGVLIGKTLQSRNNRSYFAFYGIPYAEPPIGELRFQSPVPPKPWKGVRDATSLPPPCIALSHDEKSVSGEEDCLYLNVYTPRLTNDSLMPVMVFTYGGRFMFGHALPSRYGPNYFMDKDVVLITFHYRVGPLGFLSNGDDIMPGNYGLKDEIAVLKWIQNYIKSFGGDKNSVTLFGGSSGGMAVGLTLISPLGKGLFHRAISQSGFPTNIVKSGNTARKDAWKFASYVGCNNEKITTSEDLLSCLKKLPAETIVQNSLKLFTFGHLIPALPFGPVIENEKVEGAFLVDDPNKLLQRNTDIPWIIGINADDGGFLAIYTYLDSKSKIINKIANNYHKYFPLILRYGTKIKDSSRLNEVTEKIKKYYFGDTDIRKNIRGFSKMLTGMLFITSIKECTKIYKGPKYVYYYDHRNKETFASWYGDVEEEMGVIHGDELISMYNWSERIIPVTEGIDLVVSEQILKLWTNFAAFGDPNGNEELIWEPVQSENVEYLHIKNGLLEMKKEFFKPEYEFIKSLGII